MKMSNWFGRALVAGSLVLGAAGAALGVDLPPRAGKMGPNFTCSLDLALAKDEPEVTIAFTHGYPTEFGWVLEDTMPGDDVAPATCFSSEKPPPADVIAALTQQMIGVYNDRYNAVTRWTGTIGDPLTLTWSFVPDGTPLPATPGPAANSNLFARMDALFGAANRATWISRFEQSFNRWAQVTGLRYTRVRNGTNDWDDGAAWGSGSSTTRGTIRIGMRPVDGANGILAFNQFPQSGDMILDANETWTQGGGTHLFLRNTIMHEHGHGIGLAHVCPISETKLMEPFLSTRFDGPQQDDIRAGQDFYGDPYESNNTAATAAALDPNTATTDLEPLTPGTTFNFGNAIPTPAVTGAALLSIDSHLDVDFYKFALDRSRLVTVTVTPVGTTYADEDQDNTTGNCLVTGNSSTALSAADLTLSAHNAGGTVSYGTVDDTNAGSPEVLTGVLVPAGTSTIRVSRVGTQTETQLYRLSVQVSAANLTVTASDGTFPDFVRLNWSSIPNATQYLVSRSTTNSFITSATIANGITGITYDDTTAVPGTTYFYWIRAQQNGAVRLVTDVPDSGFRPAPPACVADVDDGSGTGTPDGGVTIDDLLYYLVIYGNGNIAADVDDGSGTGTRDGGVTIDDLLYFLVRYQAGC